VKSFVLSFRSSTFDEQLRYYTARYLLTYHVIQNVLFMAYRESYEIVEFDDELIGSHVENKLHFLYGTSDPYTPLSFYEDMKALLPGRVELAEDGIRHAFVLQSSEVVGEKVAQLLAPMYAKQPEQQNETEESCEALSAFSDRPV